MAFMNQGGGAPVPIRRARNMSSGNSIIVVQQTQLPVGTPTVADWCARGKSWFLAQFSDKPIICDLLCAILDEVQVVEQEVANVRDVHPDLDLAYGESLDQIGCMLGWPREGATDDQYRLELRAVAIANTGNSSINAGAAVFAQLLGQAMVQHVQDFPAGYRIFADNALTYFQGQRYAKIGRLAKPTAVRYDFNYVPSGFAIMSFSDDVVHPAVPFAERGVPSNIRMAERDNGKD